MKATLISIGDELLIGQTVNTNASWLGEQLSLRGIEVEQVLTIPDTGEAIDNSLSYALETSDLVIITGGLGPTKDDITKHTLSEFFHSELIQDDATLERVELFFKERNRPILPVNRLQALVPACCEVLPNFHGTAPGMLFLQDDKMVISLPGVPYEMQGILNDTGFSRIEQVFNTKSLYYRTANLQGIGETTIADIMEDWENEIRSNGFGLAYLPSPGLVRMRISSRRGQSDKDKIDRYFQQLEDKLPKNVFGYDGITLEESVGHLLSAAGASIGTAESCTGGALANSIVSVGGASNYFGGGFVAYTNELKTRLLGVNSDLFTTVGAVSEEVVKEMANGARERLQVDYALSVSGIAGPTGGTPNKPVGTVWIGLATPNRTIARQYHFGNNRERNIKLTVLSGLNLLRCEILKLNS